MNDATIVLIAAVIIGLAVQYEIIRLAVTNGIIAADRKRGLIE